MARSGLPFMVAIGYYSPDLPNEPSAWRARTPGDGPASLPGTRWRMSVVRYFIGMIAVAIGCVAAGWSARAAQTPATDAAQLTTEAAKALKNPIANTAKSIARG